MVNIPPNTPQPIEAAYPKPQDRLQLSNRWVEVYSCAQLATQFGHFVIVVFHTSEDNKEHVALVRGHVLGQTQVAVRLHSECLTGDALGSLRCDCRAQLEAGLKVLGQSASGLFLYMRQEGRGIGLGNKIRAYALQQQKNLDTVEANQHLGFDDDLRDYHIAAMMLQMFGVASIALMTNNPRKIAGLSDCGIQVATRQPLIVPTNPYNAEYLATKARKSGHLLGDL